MSERFTLNGSRFSAAFAPAAETRQGDADAVPVVEPLAPAADSGVCRAVLHGAVLLVVVLLLGVAVRLPWDGDLGVHAATVERLRHRLLDPGNPLVDADTTSPYYSPWILLLGAVAELTGLATFSVLRLSALVSLPLLITGVWRFAGTLSTRRAAGPLAVLCVLFLWGPQPFAWSGFLELGSLALSLSYPSTFALALSFHLWALLCDALRGRGRWQLCLVLGPLWAVIVLSHQFSGAVATFGALGVLCGARPWPGRGIWLPLAGGFAAGLVLLAAWPYYSFFALLGHGGLETIHRSLYQDLLPRYAFVSIGVLALGLRFRRDRRDPLVVFFALGALMVTAGAVTGHWAWGRALPAAVVPAQLAAALAAVSTGSRLGRNVFAGLTGAALVAGAWAQAGALGYVVRADALPPAVREKVREPWADYRWVTPWTRYGDTVMTKGLAARQVPAYGPYTVAPGYPDFFLPDEAARHAAVDRYFAPGSSRAEQLRILHRYKVSWVLRWRSDGGLRAGDPALREVTTGPNGQVLFRVVPPPR
ncbi:hypothetical protein ACIQM4_30045 [Streptomyces sp. NPDC091272]|uniref:hypothetical protein n=1 Tax=Streptomyces sp. NPDC091272 TaxID=3365981 RepID=UPI00382A9906